MKGNKEWANRGMGTRAWEQEGNPRPGGTSSRATAPREMFCYIQWKFLFTSLYHYLSSIHIAMIIQLVAAVAQLVEQAAN